MKRVPRAASASRFGDFNLLADIKVARVPYKGSAPAPLDVIAGNAQDIITSPIAAGAHMSGGRVRALASTCPPSPL